MTPTRAFAASSLTRIPTSAGIVKVAVLLPNSPESPGAAGAGSAAAETIELTGGAGAIEAVVAGGAVSVGACAADPIPFVASAVVGGLANNGPAGAAELETVASSEGVEVQPDIRSAKT